MASLLDYIKASSASSGFFESLSTARVDAEEWSHIEPLYTSPQGLTTLHKARHFGKTVVLKSLMPEYHDEPTAEALLRKEFEVAFALQHPAIVATHDFVNLPGLGNCIVMEWLDGQTLDSVLANRKLKRREALAIATALCDALAFVHSHQTLHRDLKPANVMLTSLSNQVKLLDFGLSDTASYNTFKMPAGTPGYAAPEVMNGQQGDARSDIFSLGRVLDIMHPSFKRVAKKCTSHYPAQRYQDVQQVKDALLAITKRRWQSAAAVLAVAAVAVGLWMGQWHNSSRVGENDNSANYTTSAHDKAAPESTLTGSSEERALEAAEGEATGSPQQAEAGSDDITPQQPTTTNDKTDDGQNTAQHDEAERQRQQDEMEQLQAKREMESMEKAKLERAEKNTVNESLERGRALLRQYQKIYYEGGYDEREKKVILIAFNSQLESMVDDISNVNTDNPDDHKRLYKKALAIVRTDLRKIDPTIAR